jgi:hypothetical protein
MGTSTAVTISLSVLFFVARITHRDVVAVGVIQHQYVCVAATGLMWESTCEIRVYLACLDTQPRRFHGMFRLSLTLKLDHRHHGLGQVVWTWCVGVAASGGASLWHPTWAP